MRSIQRVGIIGYGHYGRLLHELIRRFALWIEVIVYDENIPPDGRVFVTLAEIAECDAVIFAVPRHSLEDALMDFTKQPNMRPDTVFVEVCTSKVKPGELLKQYVKENPYIKFHTPWGPEAHNNAGGDVSKLPPTIVVDHSLPDGWYEALKRFLADPSRRIDIIEMSASEHDHIIVGRKMYLTHLNSQIMQGMGLLNYDETDRAAPPSYQDLKRSAMQVRGDVGIFLDVWLDEAECQRTFDAFLAQVRRLEAMKNERANGAK